MAPPPVVFWFMSSPSSLSTAALSRFFANFFFTLAMKLSYLEDEEEDEREEEVSERDVTIQHISGKIPRKRQSSFF